ncbi:OmpL47-type beta-barrel domain-containing protein [Paenibacillus sp. V4I7]|uniref:pectate lyase family protein n=1 Tax=Paenibacillus sp. V4I7 TaxID=3042307 RepID=UPI0027D79D0D|nr:hypothetical protein [Paenibacillus sp. V4I7]
MNDLNLGWNELSAEAKTTAGSLIVAHNAPKTHPVLLQTGVSKVYLDTLNGVTIFSANGSKIKHASLILKHSTNTILRNLEFDELWEWDEATKGDYDKNDWDFLTIEDDSKVWIDHCTFNKSYDGGVDIKKGSSGVTISWSFFKGDDRSPNSWVSQQISALENNRSAYAMYNYLRSQGLSADDIIAVSSGQKKQHLVGATEFASENANLQVTLHHNYYKDMQDRLPRLRGGNAHAYNIVMDSSGNWGAKKLISDSLAAALSAKGYHFGVTSNGAISTEGGAVLIEKSQIIDMYYPLRNNQADPNNPAYTGKIFALDTMYSLDGTSFRGNSNESNSPLSPVPAPLIPFAWNGFTTLPYSYANDDPSVLRSRLLANNGAGAGKLNWSKEKWLLTELPTESAPPGAVTGLSASTSTDNSGQVSLTWNTVDRADYYNVYRSISHAGPYEAIADHLTANTLIDLALIGGTTYYYVVTASNVGGESAKSVEASVSIPLPNTAPTTVITSYSNGRYLNVNTPILTWTFNDPDAGDIQTAFQIQASSDNWTTISTDNGVIADAAELYTMGALTDGEWALRVRTKDRNGAWSEWAYRSIIIDTVAPTATVSYSALNPTYQDVVATILPSESVTVTNNNGLTQFTFSQNGSFTFTFEDAAGNTGSEMAAVNNIDKTAPITIDDAPKGWVNKDITVSLLADDMGSGVAATYYAVDGSTPQTGNRVTITSEGIHTLVYWSVDHAGNVEEMKSLSIHLDKTGPSIQLMLDKTTLWPANNKTVTVTATVYSSDNLSQVDSIVLTSITLNVPDDGVGQMIRDAQYGTLDTSFILLAKKASGETDLVYRVTYTAVDKAGNKTDAIASVTVPHDQSGKK